MRKSTPLILIIISSLFFFSSPTKGYEVCNQIIPIGETIEKTQDLHDDIFKELSNIHRELNYQINTANAVLTALGPEAKNCDEGICQKENAGVCHNWSPDITFGIKICLLGWCTPQLSLLGFAIPLCSNLPCKGQLCPKIDQVIPQINASLERFDKYVSKIQNALTKKTEIVQKLEKSREYFDKCAMTFKERGLVSQGKLVGKYPIRCEDALKNRLAVQIKEWPDEAKANCSDIDVKCPEGYVTEDCLNCVCSDALDKENGLLICAQRICKNLSNWICCQ